MTGLLNQLKFVAEDLNALGVEWSLVGALAVSIHSEPRTTRDIDIALALKLPEDQESLVSALLARGYSNPQVLMHLEPARRMGMRLQVRGQSDIPVVVDLLSQSSGIESEIVRGSEKIEVFPGLLMPIASRAHLIAMKVLAMNDADRIRDKGDLQMLLKAAEKSDVSIARSLLLLIAERGFGRGKNLDHELDQVLASYAPALSK